MWNKPDDEKIYIKMLSISSSIIDGILPTFCPKCKVSNCLRFYLRLFDKNRNRGTVWLWCINCNSAIHNSRLKFSESIKDPLEEVISDKKFDELYCKSGFDYLNQLWETKLLYPELFLNQK